MNLTPSSNRIGMLVIASLLVLTLAPSCLEGLCSAKAGHFRVGMASGTDCCADACPIRGVDSCGTMMESGKSGRLPTTAAVIPFKVPPVKRTVVPAEAPAVPFRMVAHIEIGLDALDSWPPIHLLNAQFLI